MEGTGVYAAICEVQAELATKGISKDKKNAQQGYNFRGIDDVYDVLAPVLAKHHLCILPRILSRSVTERQTKTGGAIFYVIVECEYDLVCSVDGSKHTVRTFGEAMDSADKATNKAMSAGYKYAAFQTFCIPVDVEDADKTTHDVKAKVEEDKKHETKATTSNTEAPLEEKSIHTVVTPITNVTAKKGKNAAGKEYTRYIIQAQGEDFATFSKTNAEIGKNALESGAEVLLGFSVNKFGNQLESIALNIPEEVV